jgi:urea transport system permease protein
VQQLFLLYLPESLFDVSYFVAIIAAFGFTFLFGCLLEKLVISRLYGRVIDSLLVTAGISIIL